MDGYKDCYVAFFDILGFKDRIKNSTFEEILSIFHAARYKTTFVAVSGSATDRVEKDILKPEDIHMKIMSDSIVIYVEASLFNSLPGLIMTCAYYQAALLSLPKPVLLRGGITFGPLYCNEDIIFGQGLTDAYLLESNNAQTPRVILVKALFDRYGNCNDMIKDLASRLLFNETDAFYSLDYLYAFCRLERGKHPNGTKEVYAHIEDVLATTTNQSIRDKYLYLKRRIQPYYDEIR